MIDSVSWPMIPLGEILTERIETLSPEQLQLGQIPIIAKISFKEGKISFRKGRNTSTGMILIRPGDLVISGINAPKGAIAIHYPGTNQPIAATIHYSAYQVDSNRIEIWYLWWILRSKAFQEILQERVAFGIKSELRSKQLFPIRIPLPSLSEQRQLISFIEAITDRIDRVNDAIDEMIVNCRNLPLVYLQSLIKPYAERIAFENYFAEPLRNGISLKASQISNNGNVKGKSFITVGAVSFGYFDDTQTKLVNMELPEDSPFWIEPGDLLMSRGNSPELVGGAAVYYGTRHTLAYPDLIIRIRLDDDKADLEFFEWFLRSREVRNYIRTIAVGTSPTMKKVNHSTVKNLPVPEISLTEQKHISNRIAQIQKWVENIIVELRHNRSEVEALLPSIFHKLFARNLHIKIPEFTINEITIKRAKEIADYNTELLTLVQNISIKTPPIYEIKGVLNVNTPEELTELLRRLITESQQPVTSKQLWQFSGISDIDTFYAFLKVEDKASHITEKRLGHEIYLELPHEVEVSMD